MKSPKFLSINRSKFRAFVTIIVVPLSILTFLLATNVNTKSQYVLGEYLPQIQSKVVFLNISGVTETTASRQTVNLVPDPSFEEADVLPNALWLEGGNCAIKLDRGMAYDGENSARIFGDSGECHLRTKSDTIPIEPERYYDFSCWIWSDFFSGEAFGQLRFLNENKETISTVETERISDASNNWQEVNAGKQAPANARYAQVRIKVSANSIGSAWFDDCFVGLSINLDIDKHDNPPELMSGELLTYTIVFSNSGREPATNVEVREQYPDEFVFNHAIPTPIPPFNDEWHFETLTTGTLGVITVYGYVKTDTTSSAIDNYVQIGSNETARLSEIETTRIISSPLICKVNITPDENEKKGMPGEKVPYHFTLRNSGSHSGTVSIETISSKNWDPLIIDPPPPYELLPEEPQPITISIPIPADVTQALSGTVNISMITPTIQCNDSISKSAAIVETTVNRKIGVAIEPSLIKLPADPLFFTHTLTNTGNWTDTFQLTVATSTTDLMPISTTITPSPILHLGPSQTITFGIIVSGVSTDLLSGPLTKAVITVSAESNSSPIGVDKVVDIAASMCRVNIGSSEQNESGPPGQILSYVYSITNTGVQTGNIELELISSREWGELVTPTTFLLPVGDTHPITANVMIPDDVTEATSGVEEQNIIIVTLQCENEIIQTAALATTIVERVFGVKLEPNQTKPPRNPIIFTHTLANLGNWDDIFDFAINTHPTTLSTTLQPTSPISLGPGVTIPITLTVYGVSTDITVEPRTKAIITITAQSLTDSSITTRTVNQVKTVVVFLPTINKCFPYPVSFTEQESNNNIREANLLPSNCPQYIISGKVNNPGDRDDVYKVFAKAGQLLSIMMSGTGSGNADLLLYRPGTSDVTDPRADESRGPTNNETLLFTIDEDGYWYISAFAAQSPKGGVSYNINITLTTP